MDLLTRRARRRDGESARGPREYNLGNSSPTGARESSFTYFDRRAFRERKLRIGGSPLLSSAVYSIWSVYKLVEIDSPRCCEEK